MDGTIVDTEKIWAEANRVLIESKDVKYTPEIKKELSSRIHGLALRQSCQIIKDLLNLKQPLEELIKEKSHIAHELYKKGVVFIDGFVEFHGQVVKHQLKSGIATNADEQTLQYTAQALNLHNFFGQHMYSIAQVGYVCKPDPAIYLHAANQLKVKPELCIAIEDSAHGIAAAQRAGMYCIGINTSRNLEQVKKSNLIVDSYQEIDFNKLLH